MLTRNRLRRGVAASPLSGAPLASKDLEIPGYLLFERACIARLEREPAELGYRNGARHEALTAPIAAPNVGNSAIGQKC
jgi:hypothetical protein